MLATAEIRWFWRDEKPDDLHRWFMNSDPAPGGGQVRIDEYLKINESEVGIKSRGQSSAVEIKGLVSVHRAEPAFLASYFEIWCKWSLTTPFLRMNHKVIVQKKRWVRSYNVSSAGAPLEIPLQADGKPLNGDPLPEQSCNVEMTEIQIGENAGQWWTFGLEASGDLDRVSRNLHKTAALLLSQSLPTLSSGALLNYPSWLTRINA